MNRIVLHSSLLLASLALTACAGHPPSRPAADPVASTPVPFVAPSRLSAGAPEGTETPAGWFRAGREAAIARGADRAKARNLILFIGDGMGPTTVAAARILQGQRQGASGEETQLSFERFPALALSKTYNTDLQTPDSAGTMTAMASGLKTLAGVLGVDQTIRRGRCENIEAASHPSLFDFADGADMASALVTTTRITHATPAALYAHSPDRNWEGDAAMPESARAAGCTDLAAQLIAHQDHGGPQIVLGGGSANFIGPDVHPVGRRADGRNLIEEWTQRHPGGHFVLKREELLALPADGQRVFGLFTPSHMSYELDRENGHAADEPGLAEMTRFSLQRLQADGRPYLLVVEGGRIDHAHHAGMAQRALVDTIALAEAVAVADELTSADDTLIVVTADHSHAFNFVGYPPRGNDILGLVRDFNGQPLRDLGGRPYTTLSYANGPGAGQPTLEGDSDTRHADFRQPALFALESETHGGEDVAVYARGPGSEAVRGSIEQHVIFHILTQAQPTLRAAVTRRLEALAP